MSKPTQLKTRRCRIGACSNSALPAMRECAACRRVRVAAALAKAAGCQVASEIVRKVTP
jgi:hypothetical protein